LNQACIESDVENKCDYSSWDNYFFSFDINPKRSFMKFLYIKNHHPKHENTGHSYTELVAKHTMKSIILDDR